MKPDDKEMALRVVNSAFVNQVVADYQQFDSYQLNHTHAPVIDLKTPLGKVLVDVANWIEAGKLQPKSGGSVQTGGLYLLDVVLHIQRLVTVQSSKNFNMRLFLRIDRSGKADYLLGTELKPNGQYSHIDTETPQNLLKMLTRN